MSHLRAMASSGAVCRKRRGRDEPSEFDHNYMCPNICCILTAFHFNVCFLLYRLKSYDCARACKHARPRLKGGKHWRKNHEIIASRYISGRLFCLFVCFVLLIVKLMLLIFLRCSNISITFLLFTSHRKMTSVHFEVQKPTSTITM